MADTTHTTIDQIDQQATLAERVRKLEIMPVPGRRSRGWRPRELFVHIIASQITLMGCWKGDADWFHGQDITDDPFVPLASRLVYQQLLAETGNGFAGASAQTQWTTFLYHMRAIPHPFWVQSFTGTGEPARSVQYTSADNTDLRPRDRTLTWTGLKAGFEWNFVQEGVTVGKGTAFMPYQDDPAYYPPDLQTALGPKGGWLNSTASVLLHNGMRWGIIVNEPCGGVRPEPMDLSQFGGIPEIYTAHGPCPSAPSGSILSGENSYWWFWNPGFETIRLWGPPRPRASDEAGIHGNYNRLWTYPGLTDLENRVDTYLDLFPAVKGFYDRAVPAAIARLRSGPYFSWEPLDLIAEWDGNVDGHRAGNRVQLRGEAVFNTISPDPPETIAYGVDVTLGRPPSAAGTNIAVFYAPVTHPAGTSLELFTYEYFGGGAHDYTRLHWDRSATADILPRSTPGPFEIDFSGVSFPVRHGT